MKKKDLPKHTKCGATSFIVDELYDDEEELPDHFVDLILNGHPPPKPYEMFMSIETRDELDRMLREYAK